MTREDAIYEIRQLAVLSTNKNIERITEALNMAIEALQDEIWKDEPNSSEIPNNCANCKHLKKHNGNLADWVCDRKGSIVTNPYDKECDEMWERKDEPQTCEECEHWNDTEDGCADRHGCKDEPQTFDKPPKCLGCLYSDLDKAFHPCASCENFSKYVGEVSGKDEPQTDCAWKKGE